MNPPNNYLNAVEGRIGNWMQTASGKAYWPNDPRPSEVDIMDIASSLSKQCRYGGHCKKFYSVAEHSVYVSNHVPMNYAMRALLHDATEAYVVDVPRPLKAMLGAAYADIEAKNWAAICKRFGLPLHDPEGDSYVKNADNAVLLAEARQLMTAPPFPWNVEGEPAKEVILAVGPPIAEAMFLGRYFQLKSFGEALAEAA